MEKFGQWVNEFSKTPAGIIIASTLCAILFLMYLFAKTSIGRKALLELRTKATVTKAHADTTRENCEKELKEQKINAEEQFKYAFAIIKEERKEIFEVLKLIPNAKVKKFIKDHENIDIEELVKEKLNNSQNG